MIETLQELVCNLSEQIFVHASEAWRLDKLVQIDVQQFKHDHIVPPEKKAVKHLHDPIFVRVLVINAIQKFGFNLAIVSLLLFVFADFDGHGLTAILHIDASDDLAKGSSVNDLVN